MMHTLHYLHRLSGIRFLWIVSLFILVGSTAYAQERSITGTVTGEGGEPIPGVNILVKGTTQGTITDIEGQYRLSVPEAAETMVYSFVGYQTKEVPIANQSTIDVQLMVDDTQLNEVVVTALGVERESKALGYAVQEVEGSSITQAREPNLINSLSGRVAGVQVTNGGSGVGSSARITIRGENSLIPGNNSPLFVVDGIPINNETRSVGGEGNMETDYGNGAGEINPDDIANISVLKGANATALYGSRGANGVILITTKSGRGTEGIGVSVNSSTMFERPLRIPNYQNQYGQGAGFAFAFGDGFGAGVNDNIDESWGPRLDQGQDIPQHDSPTTNGYRGGDSDPSIDRGEIIPTPWTSDPDNIKNFFRTGYTLSNNVALTGGNEKGNFRLSYTNLTSEGILPNTDLKRNTVAFNTEYSLTSKLKASASVNYITDQSDNRPNNSYGTENIMYLWVWFGRQIDMSSLENYWQPGLEGVQQFNYNYNWHDNPYLTMYENTNAFEKGRIIGNVQVTYDFTDNLKLMLRSGTDFFNELRLNRRAFSTQRYPFGQYREDKIYFQERNSDFLLTYNKQVNSDFDFTISLGGNRRDLTDRYNRTSANQLSIPEVYNFGNSRIPLVTVQNDQRKRVNSLYGFANFGYKGVLFLDVTGRNDWSSTLPENNNSYFYPSVSGSAILSDIFALSSNSALSFAKLRAGWAQVGNDTDPYQLRNVYNFQQPYGNIQRVSGSSLIANSNLKPERQTSFEIGTDLRFFNDRVRLDATYYTTSSRNQILQLPVDITSGYNRRVINAGEIQNRGIEVMLDATPIQLDNGLGWNINLNFTRNRSEVVSLYEDLDTYQVSENYVQILAKEGGRMGDLYGTGFAQTPDGQTIYENGYPVRDPNLRLLGNYNPDFMVGAYNTITYKNLSLGFLFDWRQGGVVNSRTVLIGGTSGMMDFTAESRENGIVGIGVKNVGTAENPEYVTNDVILSGRDYYWSRYNRGNEEVGTFDASFVKLREVKFGYQIPGKLFGNFPLRDLSVSVVGRNLALWTENTHFDPEIISFDGGTVVPGVEDMATPSSRSIGFNINFKF